MTTYNELEAKFKKGEITMETYLSTPTEPGSFKVTESKKHGRKSAKKQAAMVANLDKFISIPEQPLESASVCEMCGNNVGGPKSLCCEARAITPSAYAKPHQIFLSITGKQGATIVRWNGTVATLRAEGYPKQELLKNEENGKESAFQTLAAAEELIRAMAKLPGWEVRRVDDDAPAASPKQEVIKNEQGEGFVAEPAQLTTVEKQKAFILAGNAYFTVRSLKTGVRYTFRVALPHKNPEETCKYCHNINSACTCPIVHFVSYLAGPDNGRDYIYLGMIRNGKFSVSRASKRLENSSTFKAFRWVWEHLSINQIPPQTEIWHEGRCGRCGHKLTVPESIESGIGPICEGKE